MGNAFAERALSTFRILLRDLLLVNGMLKYKIFNVDYKHKKIQHHTTTCNNIQLDGRLSKYIMML